MANRPKARQQKPINDKELERKANRAAILGIPLQIIAIILTILAIVIPILITQTSSQTVNQNNDLQITTAPAERGTSLVFMVDTSENMNTAIGDSTRFNIALAAIRQIINTTSIITTQTSTTAIRAGGGAGL